MHGVLGSAPFSCNTVIPWPISANNYHHDYKLPRPVLMRCLLLSKQWRSGANTCLVVASLYKWTIAAFVLCFTKLSKLPSSKGGYANSWGMILTFSWNPTLLTDRLMPYCRWMVPLVMPCSPNPGLNLFYGMQSVRTTLLIQTPRSCLLPWLIT